ACLVCYKHHLIRDGRIHTALLSVPIMWWRKPCEGLHAGMVHLPWGDVREAPTTERSFLAGETERNFVFEITN
ncbi:MAG: hypothetical protein WA915_07265, partial [Candidatus Aminicenantaceae bacterium]